MLSKVLDVRIKYNVGAIFISSTVKNEQKELSLSRSGVINQHPKCNNNDLVTVDKHKIELYLQKQTCVNMEISIEFPGFIKMQALDRLSESINKPEMRGFMLLILGHSVIFPDKTVQFVIAENVENSDNVISFEDLIHIWENRTNKNSNKHLLLILDFPNSGAWINCLKNMGREDISIQTSAKFHDKPSEVGISEGIFLNNFLFANNALGFQFIDPQTVMFSGTKHDITQYQTPCFIGNKLLVKKLFGVQIGFNSWDDLSNSSNIIENDQYYLGQIGELYNSTSFRFDPVMHGVGSIWKSGGQFVYSGEFQNNKLVKKFNGGMLNGLNSPPGFNSVKIDSVGNLLYGTFKNGYLEGKSIFSTALKGAWQGNFMKGYLVGECKFTNPQGWMFVGLIHDEVFIEIKKLFNPSHGEVKFEFKPNNPSGQLHVVDQYRNISHGNFIDGKMVGEGTMFLNSGYHLTAQFANDLIVKIKEVRKKFIKKIALQLVNIESQGQGSWIEDSGNIYFGRLIDGQKEGYGTFLLKSGDHYEGDFESGLFHGKGKYTYLCGNYYEGDFFNNLFCGKGKILLFNGDYYEGEFRNDLFNGKGKLTFANGKFYEGEFENGEREGKGKMNYANGHVYEGDFQENLSSGKGKLTFSNGDTYQGDFLSDCSHGKGKLLYASGNVYEGEFKNGKCEGRGKITFACGNMYKGDIKKGCSHGKGRLIMKNGDSYQGDFINGVFEGMGVYLFQNGNRYEGQFEAGSFNGEGKMYYINDDLYQGQFKKGRKHGLGKMFYSNNSRYEGMFKDDQKDGAGIYILLNSNKYEGEFKNGRFDGKGKFTYGQTGDIYFGDYKNGHRQGFGKVIFANGSTYEGEFKNDIFDGKGTLLLESGEILEGNWTKGHL